MQDIRFQSKIVECPWINKGRFRWWTSVTKIQTASTGLQEIHTGFAKRIFYVHKSGRLCANNNWPNISSYSDWWQSQSAKLFIMSSKSSKLVPAFAVLVTPYYALPDLRYLDATFPNKWFGWWCFGSDALWYFSMNISENQSVHNKTTEAEILL